MTAVQAHVVLELLLALGGALVARVGDPAVRLQQHGGAEVRLLVPPVRGARGGAAGAQDALVQAVELAPLLLALPVLAPVRRRRVALQVRLDRLVLLVEVREVRHQVLDHVHVRQRVDARLLGGVGGYSA